MNRMFAAFCLVAIGVNVASGAFTMKEAKKLKMGFWEDNMDVILANQNVPSILGKPQQCSNGRVVLNGDIFRCDNVDFLSLIGRRDIRVERRDYSDSFYEMSDIWGYLSPSGREITLACQTNSMVFIDSTDPISPKVLGYMESHRAESYWCDVKVYKDTAYIVQDRLRSGDNDKGIQVFDLRRLESRQVQESSTPIKFEPDFTYREHGAVHNVVIDTETGFLYNVGSSGGTDCNGGLHMVDLSNPLRPTFAGCAAQDGYVHDAQCLIYDGPDGKYRGREICFGYNEDEITIYDVTVKSSPRIISKTGYPEATYTHQGWLNPEQTHLLMNDELDEEEDVVPNTRTYVVNIESLEAPYFTGAYNHPAVSIDHNLYFFGDMHRRGHLGNGPIEDHPALNYAYCSNYASGVRIIDTSRMTNEPPVIEQAGFFDVSLQEGNVFFGAWSSYLHPSGVLAVTSIERGVFFLRFRDTFEEPDDRTRDVPEESLVSNGLPGTLILLYVFIGVLTVVALVYNVQQISHSVQTLAEESVKKKQAQSTVESRIHANPMFLDEDTA